MVNVDSLSFTERLVLLSITVSQREGETPVESLTLKHRTREILEETETTVVGELSEREVMRALNALGAEPYIEEDRPATSATGKGRPKYALDVPPETVLEELENDEQLAAAIEQSY